jgi:hypothetical protein
VAQPSVCNGPAKPQLAEMQLQLEATRREVTQLQANQRQPEVACGLSAAERAAARAEDQRIASSHRELQEAWKGMVAEMKEQLKVRGGHANAGYHLDPIPRAVCLAHAVVNARVFNWCQCSFPCIQLQVATLCCATCSSFTGVQFHQPASS